MTTKVCYLSLLSNAIQRMHRSVFIDLPCGINVLFSPALSSLHLLRQSATRLFLMTLQPYNSHAYHVANYKLKEEYVANAKILNTIELVAVKTKRQQIHG